MALTAEEGRIAVYTEGSFVRKIHNGVSEGNGVNYSDVGSGQYPIAGVIIITPTIDRKRPVSSYQGYMSRIATRAKAPSFFITQWSNLWF
ncbi:hypothetical protein [Marinicella rhabdoformis]|uniref:hypothetical protein n=1 Tax=Marinicella rhabdoformis TaxID=2580566 RepID=UPI0012AEC8F2|nr:hypothetical protein [Marinicella rhabdoformis]